VCVCVCARVCGYEDFDQMVADATISSNWMTSSGCAFFWYV